MKLKYIPIYFLFFMLLMGCRQQQTVESTSVPPTEIVDTQKTTPSTGTYPEPETEPYVYPVAPVTLPYTFRTSESGKVTLHGVLVVMDPDLGMPKAGDSIFLVPLPEGEGVTMMPSFEVGKVPQADVDERTGEFVFTDIEPGRYVVMIYTIGNAQIPARREDGGFAIVNVKEEDRDQTIEVDYLRTP